MHAPEHPWALRSASLRLRAFLAGEWARNSVGVGKPRCVNVEPLGLRDVYGDGLPCNRSRLWAVKTERQLLAHGGCA